ncbi:gas vesicle protein GvpO [Streptomyces sp. NPDC096176]|uniref:gas vesicle protein GvpO n=1 Tax=Streptomyces sp. NPDC096176 TaxID=3366079 RepID=UPI003823E5C0
MAERRRTQARPASAASSRRNSSQPGLRGAARAASDELQELIGHPAEGVSAVRRNEDGWCVVVDVLEVPRIPDTTSLLAAYEVQLGGVAKSVGKRKVRKAAESDGDTVRRAVGGGRADEADEADDAYEDEQERPRRRAPARSSSRRRRVEA